MKPLCSMSQLPADLLLIIHQGDTAGAPGQGFNAQRPAACKQIQDRGPDSVSQPCKNGLTHAIRGGPDPGTVRHSQSEAFMRSGDYAHSTAPWLHVSSWVWHLVQGNCLIHLDDCINEFISGEFPEVFRLFADADVAYGNSEFVRKCKDHPTLPFAVPSSLVRHSPVTFTTELKVFACEMAFCPVVPSSTSMTS